MSKFFIAAAICSAALLSTPVLAKESVRKAEQPEQHSSIPADAAPIAALFSGMVLMAVANRRRNRHKVLC